MSKLCMPLFRISLMGGLGREWAFKLRITGRTQSFQLLLVTHINRLFSLFVDDNVASINTCKPQRAHVLKQALMLCTLPSKSVWDLMISFQRIDTNSA